TWRPAHGGLRRRRSPRAGRAPRLDRARAGDRGPPRARAAAPRTQRAGGRATPARRRAGGTAQRPRDRLVLRAQGRRSPAAAGLRAARPCPRRARGAAGDRSRTRAAGPGAVRDRLQPLVDQAGSGAERVSAGMARVQLALGDARRAEAILAGLRHSDDPVVAAEAWLTSALLANRSRADHLARTSLDRAVALAEPTGIRRPFVVQREPRLDAMLRRRLQLGESDGRFVATLLGEIPGPDR